MNIDAWMGATGTSLAARSGDNGWSKSQAISIIYHIALYGEYVATDVHFPLDTLTAEEIAAACQRLEDEEFTYVVATGVE